MSLLRTEGLTISIGKKIICRDLSIELKAGQVWGILGPNGCGKTTLLHTLGGLYPSTNGHIWLGKNRLESLSVKAIAQYLGILFQDMNDVFLQTVFDYCLAARFPHRAYFQRENIHDKQIVLHALQQMDMHALIHRPIYQLSGGEKRRLAIAAVIAQTPKVFLLDELTNHLDLRHQIHSLTLFKNLARLHASTIFMTLHDINLAQQYCDHVLLMFANGDILHGPSQAILTCHNLTRLYEQSLKKITDGNVSLWWPA